MSENPISNLQPINQRQRTGTRGRIAELLERNKIREAKRAARAAEKEKAEDNVENIKSIRTGPSEDQPDGSPTPGQEPTEYGKGFLDKIAEQQLFFVAKFKKVEEAFSFLLDKVASLETYVDDLTKSYKDGKHSSTDEDDSPKKKGPPSKSKPRPSSEVKKKKLEDKFPPQRLPVGDPKLDIMSGGRSDAAIKAEKDLGGSTFTLKK